MRLIRGLLLLTALIPLVSSCQRSNSTPIPEAKEVVYKEWTATMKFFDDSFAVQVSRDQGKIRVESADYVFMGVLEGRAKSYILNKNKEVYGPWSYDILERYAQEHGPDKRQSLEYVMKQRGYRALAQLRGALKRPKRGKPKYGESVRVQVSGSLEVWNFEQKSTNYTLQGAKHSSRSQRHVYDTQYGAITASSDPNRAYLGNLKAKTLPKDLFALPEYYSEAPMEEVLEVKEFYASEKR